MHNDFSSKFDKVCLIIDEYQRDPSKLIPILQRVQEEYKYLPEDIMTYIATALGISPGTVYGAATFYSHFTLTPKGKYIIKVCDGTACHVKKAGDLIEAMEKALGLNAQKKTSDDLMFTLETVACLGACGLAPVIVINDQVHGAMNVEKALALLEKLREDEGSK